MDRSCSLNGAASTAGTLYLGESGAVEMADVTIFDRYVTDQELDRLWQSVKGAMGEQAP